MTPFPDLALLQREHRAHLAEEIVGNRGLHVDRKARANAGAAGAVTGCRARALDEATIVPAADAATAPTVPLQRN
jgi:hypothetical protein